MRQAVCLHAKRFPERSRFLYVFSNIIKNFQETASITKLITKNINNPKE